MPIKRKKHSSESTITKNEPAKPINETDYKTMFEFYNQKFVPDATLSRLAEYMLQWVNERKDAVIFGEFLCKYGIAPKTLDQFIVRSEKLKNAKAITLQILGVRREKYSMYRKIDSNVMRMKQHQYDPEWEAAEIRQVNLRNQDTSNRDVRIILPSIDELVKIGEEKED